MPTIFETISGSSTAVGSVDLYASEQAFFDRPETVEFWDARGGFSEPDIVPPAYLAATTPYWEGRKQGIKLLPLVDGQLPIANLAGGPSGQGYAQGRSPTPAGILLSEADKPLVTAGADFTVAIIASHGTLTTSRPFSIVGNDGSMLHLAMRTANIVSVSRVNAAGSGSSAGGGTSSGPGFHLVEIAYKHSTTRVVLRIDGVQVADTTIALNLLTSRISLMGAYDLTDGIAGEGVGNGVAMVAIANVFAPDNADWAAALKAYVNDVFPSIPA